MSLNSSISIVKKYFIKDMFFSILKGHFEVKFNNTLQLNFSH